MRFEDLTWREVEGYLAKRKDVLIPLGSTEEHGHHLPISTDAVIAERLCEKASEVTGVVVAPIIKYGVCRSTAGYPGTISVSLNGLREFVYDVMEGLSQQGFTTFYLVTGHGGGAHRVAIEEAAVRVKAREGVRIYLFNPYDVDLSDLVTANDAHAGEVETSLMLYLEPESVHMEKAVDDEAKKGVEVRSDWRPTKSGVFGKSKLATKKKGEFIFKRFVTSVVDLIKGAQ